MPQLYNFIAEQFKENLMLGGQPQQQHMVAGRLCQYLKSWQLDGLRFLYKNFEKGEACILNDESGLGKVVTVSTFLGSILTNDTTKKCLIVVRDDETIERWRFHLSVLTQLTVKVIERTSDINFETIFLIKWSTLKNICEIDKVNFDHIIIDNRGEMLNNKFCSGILLRYFENKTTIIISSVDVTSDIKLLHILLRLCGRLDRQYTDVRTFEDKFQLPQLKEGVSNKVDLEDYFLKREKVINFCREFRLRRYCHQFDEEFPIVSRSEFQRYIEQWQSQNKNSLSSGSVKLLSSSSEKDTEELFKEYFQVKEERDKRKLDREVQQINQDLVAISEMDVADVSDDLVVMSPLLLVSESDSDDDQTQIQNQQNSQFIEDIKDEEDGLQNISKDTENTPVVNRRKSKKPVKTLTRKNNIDLNDSKHLRSRALQSAKKPLPIHTKSKKSVETEKADDSAKQKQKEEDTKKSENIKKVKKIKVCKEIENTKSKTKKEGKKEPSSKEEDKTLNKIKDKKKTMEHEKLSTEKSNKPDDNKPEESSKPKAIEASKGITPNESKRSPKIVKEDAHQKKKSAKTVQDKNTDCQEKNKEELEKVNLKGYNRLVVELNKRETNLSKPLEKDAGNETDHNEKDKSKNKICEEKNNKRKRKDSNDTLQKTKKMSTSSLVMLEEALKFIRNENIGRRSKTSETTKRRSKALEVPTVIRVAKKSSEISGNTISSSKIFKSSKDTIQTKSTKKDKTEISKEHKSTASNNKDKLESPKENKKATSNNKACNNKDKLESPKENKKATSNNKACNNKDKLESPKENKKATSNNKACNNKDKLESPKENKKATSNNKDKFETPKECKSFACTNRDKTESPKETKKTTSNSKDTFETPKRSAGGKILTELTPLGVHSKSTRGMERLTRSAATSNKYRKVAVAQIGIRRRPVVSVKKISPVTKCSKPPSPTPPVISESPVESMQLGQALTPTNGSLVSDFIAPAPKNLDYHFPLMLDKDISDSECQITSHGSNIHEVIVLTDSSNNDHDMEPPRSTVSRRKAIVRPPMVTIHRPIFNKAKSPDLFSTCSDLSLPCSQQTSKSNFEGFKIFGSELRQPANPRSCLEILDRMLEPRSGIVAVKKNSLTQENPRSSHHQHCVEDEDAMFEITSNGTFGNTVHINANGEMSPIRNKNHSTPPSSGHPKNRITNYLISNSQHTSVVTLPPQTSSMEDNTDLLPKTPKRRKSLSGTVKRSPRAFPSSGITGAKSQSTKLTQWLVKNSNAHISDSVVKPPSSKRRRLDLSFPDK